MAKKYVEKLSKLIEELNLDDKIEQPLEVKHFFSGAALFLNPCDYETSRWERYFLKAAQQAYNVPT